MRLSRLQLRRHCSMMFALLLTTTMRNILVNQTQNKGIVRVFGSSSSVDKLQQKYLTEWDFVVCCFYYYFIFKSLTTVNVGVSSDASASRRSNAPHRGSLSPRIATLVFALVKETCFFLVFFFLTLRLREAASIH